MMTSRADYMRRYRAAKRSAGVCIECRAPAPDGVRCDWHTMQNTDAQQRRREAVPPPPPPPPAVCVMEGCDAPVEYAGTRCPDCWLDAAAKAIAADPPE